jgi:hypothetical protein
MRSIQELRAHAHSIADAYRVLLIENDDMPMENAGLALFANGANVIFARTIADEYTYAIVMHELGHLAHPAGRLRTSNSDNPRLKLDEEYAAWEWAEKFALGGWTTEMEAAKHYGLSSYERNYAA